MDASFAVILVVAAISLLVVGCFLFFGLFNRLRYKVMQKLHKLGIAAEEFRTL